MTQKRDTQEVTERPFFIHESAVIDEDCEIGEGTKIWHFCHVSTDAKLGEKCSLGQNVFVAPGVMIGNNVKIQNNVSLYTGTVVEDDVFLGPSCVLTNVSNPRAQVVRRGQYEKTLLRRGCSIGANATVVCGITIGRYAFVAAGAVVTRDVPDYALIVGVPGRQAGYMSRHGYRLSEPDAEGIRRCPVSNHRYQEESGILRCLDLDEESSLSQKEATGTLSYEEFRVQRKKS
ncbi:acyltransferase [Myxococcota bacterium]